MVPGRSPVFAASCPPASSACLFHVRLDATKPEFVALHRAFGSNLNNARNVLEAGNKLTLRCRAAAEPQHRRKSEEIILPDFFEVDRDAAAFNLIFESTQALKTARHYEVVFLVHEDHVEEVKNVIQKVKGFIEEKKGKIYRLDEWGMRKLAYKIKRSKRAYYILMNFEIGAEDINGFDSLLEKDERVIRHLMMTKKQAETKETVPPPEFSSIRDVDELDEDDSEEYDEIDGDAEEVKEVEELSNA